MLMSCCSPNYMSEKISFHLIGQACCHFLSWQWRITSFEHGFNDYSIVIETFRLHFECRASEIASCNCFVPICYCKPDGTVTLIYFCSLIKEALRRENNSRWQGTCLTVMAPYVMNNSTTLFNSPPVENNTLGAALVPLSGKQNKDSDMFIPVTSHPYSLKSPSQNTGSGATATVVAKIADDAEDTTATGIPISLIWMPYVLLTLIIISLMIASFCKYHKKHGHKYVRRREELAKKHQQALNQMNLQLHIVQNQVGHTPGVRESDRGGRGRGPGLLPPNGGPSSIEAGSSSRYLGHNKVGTKTSSVMKTTPIREPNKQRSNNSKSASKQPQQTSSSRPNNGRNLPKNNKRHKPLTFTRNENGSMVDLRVVEKEKGRSTKMFKTPFYSHKALSPLTVPCPGEYLTLPTTLPSATSPLAYSDDDDDHSHLIHQTKL